jgi:alanyl-tRNA synthetase
VTTERLYYNDSYTTRFNAVITELTTYRDRPAIVLDKTFFYPESGGQPADNGRLRRVTVMDVQIRESDQAVLHILEATPDHLAEVFEVGMEVAAEVNDVRRADYRAHHSGQHILSQALIQRAEAETVGFHMSADSITIDVNRANIPENELRNAETLANEIVQSNVEIRAWFPELDELETLQRTGKLRKMPDVVGKVRIVDIGGFDVTACGGTHVARTGEIGMIKIVKTEKRGSTTRIEFRCGVRALSDYRSKHEVITALVNSATVAYTELPDTFARLQTQNKTLQSELKMAMEQLADYEAQDLIRTGEMRGNTVIVARAFVDRDLDRVKLLVQRLVAQPGIVALVGLAGDKAQLMFGRSENVQLDVVPLLKAALKTLGTDRGGGRPNMAQGGGIAASVEQVQAVINAAKDQVING